jgi:hypothetical protein
MIAHHGIITGPFNAKNGHRPHSFRILGTKKPQSSFQRIAVFNTFQIFLHRTKTAAFEDAPL